LCVYVRAFATTLREIQDHPEVLSGIRECGTEREVERLTGRTQKGTGSTTHGSSYNVRREKGRRGFWKIWGYK
jgi:hypothetical protein